MKVSTLSNGRSAAKHLGAGEILLTSMDTDGVQTGFDCELTRLCRRGNHYSRDRLRRRRKARRFCRRVLTEAGPMPLSPHPSFITASTPSTI